MNEVAQVVVLTSPVREQRKQQGYESILQRRRECIREVHHGKLHQHRAERSAVGVSRKCVHRFTTLLSVSDASGEQKGIEHSTTGYGSESVLVTLAWSAPIPVTTVSSMLTDGFRGSSLAQGPTRCASSASPGVPPTGRERMLSHNALQWSLVRREVDRDT